MKFNLEDKELIRSCRPILDRLYKDHKKKYIDLFFYEKDILFTKFDITPLIKTKIIRELKGKFRANVQVFPLSGKFICTDFNYSTHRKIGKTYTTQRDGVWGILPEETPVMAKKTIVKKGDVVLDLATGSGMIGIFCAEKAKKVIATDINPRAINYAKFNSILNGVDHKMEFRVGNLFNPVKGIKFDLVVWNGPTVAVPETPEKYPVYSYGGMDGAEFTRKFIDSVFDYLKPNGRLQWYDCSVGTEKIPVSMEYLKRKWKDKEVKAIFNSLTLDPVSLEKSFKVYSKVNLENPKIKTPLSVKTVTKNEEGRWHNWLKERGYTHFYYAFVQVNPSDKFEFKMNFPKKDIRTDRYLTRYWLWMSYQTILKKLEFCEWL
ncbi:MAG: methyltransferase domain-containing protein [Candidatus Aenigmarchaeota archaeon]|nr:methyltransferase domain-containing protein [Candidatus Aenigmarchaeota archaeon]